MGDIVKIYDFIIFMYFFNWSSSLVRCVLNIKSKLNLPFSL